MNSCSCFLISDFALGFRLFCFSCSLFSGVWDGGRVCQVIIPLCHPVKAVIHFLYFALLCCNEYDPLGPSPLTPQSRSPLLCHSAILPSPLSHLVSLQILLDNR